MKKIQALKQIMKYDAKDIEELKDLLLSLKSYYQDISDKYSIKNDLVEITDKRRAIAKTFDEEINIFREKASTILGEATRDIGNTQGLIENASNEIEILSAFRSEIEEINSLLHLTREDGTEYREELFNLLDSENVNRILKDKKEIVDSWNELFEEDDNGSSLYDKVKIKISNINNLYANLFNIEEGQQYSKETFINTAYDNILQKHKEIISGYKIVDDDGNQIDVKSYYSEIKDKKEELILFYNKIFGTDNNKSLVTELDERLSQLEKIEQEAKKVINLSSDAGLAGGFWQRGEKAKKNKFVSLLIFVFSLFLLGYFNFNTIDFNNLKDITFQSIAIRLIINTPFVWIAVVSNINLNKYSRLEEEYAHKESLAKSFERYKEQIENLEDKKVSTTLMNKLLATNIDAFEKNAAETMIHAKSDMPSPLTRKEKNETPKEEVV